MDKIDYQQWKDELTAEEFEKLVNERDSLQQQLTELKQHLREIEWTETYDAYSRKVHFCPACDNSKDEGHTDTCWLHNAIKE